MEKVIVPVAAEAPAAVVNMNSSGFPAIDVAVAKPPVSCDCNGVVPAVAQTAAPATPKPVIGEMQLVPVYVAGPVVLLSIVISPVEDGMYGAIEPLPL